MESGEWKWINCRLEYSAVKGLRYCSKLREVNRIEGKWLFIKQTWHATVYLST